MRRVPLAVGVGVLLLLAGPAGAQEKVNQDYFAASTEKDLQTTLWTVENYHLNERVIEAFRNAQYHSVIADLQFVLNRFPNHPRALMLLCSTAELTEDPDLAISHFQAALRLFPQYPLTRAQYGHCLVELGRPSTGVGELKRATDMDPRLAPAQAWLAQALYRVGDDVAGRQAEARARDLGFTGPIEKGTR